MIRTITERDVCGREGVRFMGSAMFCMSTGCIKQTDRQTGMAWTG